MDINIQLHKTKFWIKKPHINKKRLAISKYMKHRKFNKEKDSRYSQKIQMKNI